MDKISIIIPVYNVENFLEKCLDSVINQTYKNLEIICVNDGSKDNSLKILNEYAKKDERICVVNKKNGGLSSARNAGLDIASGKYCYFLDSDDWIELNTIELLVEKMTTNDVDVVVHGIKNICYDEQSRQIVQDCENWLNSFNKEQGVFFVPLEINEKIPCVAWNKLYKMEIINKYNCRFPEGLINEDEAFIWTYMIHCDKYYYLDLLLYNYLRRSDSIMGKKDTTIKVLDILKIQEIIYQTVFINNKIDMYKEVLTKNYIVQLNHLFSYLPKKFEKQALNLIKKYMTEINSDDRIRETYNRLKIQRRKEMFEKLFSIKTSDDRKRKILTILGFKIKFKRSIKKYIAKTPIQGNKIVFNNFLGKGYGCNPKYIAHEIIRQKLPYELVWLVRDVEKHKDEFPPEIRLVEYNVENAIDEFASAKVWISNQRMPDLYKKGLYKKPEQFYIQTWHGWTPIKQIEKDIEEQKKDWCKWAKVDSQYMDLLTASSQLDKKRLSRCFYFDGEITDFGIPRNDLFYMNEEQKKEIRQNICLKYNIPLDNKILLYAPTFRDDGRLDCYDVDVKKVLETLEQKDNCNYTLVARLHPNVAEKAEDVFAFDEYIDATYYPDVMELLLAADVLISDYSCLMFEFMHTRKPVFLYGNDLDMYLKERKFYIDIKSLFFPFAQTNKELIENINNFNEKEYVVSIEQFVEKAGSLDKGLSSYTIVEKIKEKIND